MAVKFSCYDDSSHYIAWAKSCPQTQFCVSQGGIGGRIGMKRSPASAFCHPHHPPRSKRTLDFTKLFTIGFSSNGIAIDRLYILIPWYVSFSSHHPRFTSLSISSFIPYLSTFAFSCILQLKYLLFPSFFFVSVVKIS